jgi:protein transport protein SEC24
MGVYLQILSSIQSIIDSVQCPERTDIAIVTYDQRMNFYNIPSNLASEPQVIVVSDLDDVNIPLPIEKLFLNVVNDREKISYLIEKLQKLAETVQASKVH